MLEYRKVLFVHMNTQLYNFLHMKSKVEVVLWVDIKF